VEFWKLRKASLSGTRTVCGAERENELNGDARSGFDSRRLVKLESCG
jgi:hypothetical protein